MFGLGKVFITLLDIFHIVIATLNTYFFIYFFGRKVSAAYIIAFSVLHLLYLHLKLFLYKYGDWSLGIETLYMMSICKFSSIAFNYEDGDKEEKELISKYFMAK
jgi:hypothetical protein